MGSRLGKKKKKKRKTDQNALKVKLISGLLKYTSGSLLDVQILLILNFRLLAHWIAVTTHNRPHFEGGLCCIFFWGGVKRSGNLQQNVEISVFFFLVIRDYVRGGVIDV